MIEISVTDGVPSVWRADDACQLLETHRIVGTLVGSLPRYPKQDVQLGLPLQLLLEEATLLRDRGIAKFTDGNVSKSKPTPEDVKKFQDTRKRIYEEQVEFAKKDKEEQLERMKSQIIEGKLAKRRKQLGGESVDEKESEKNDAEIFDVQKELESYSLPTKAVLVQTPTVLDSSPSAPHIEWNYPSDDTEKLRYKVYSDLWDQGYYLSTGSKFGGDFLAYPGDPGRYHSFYIVVCIDKNRKLSAIDIATYARLGSNVKKTVLLCSENEDNSVNYTSLQWTGIT